MQELFGRNLHFLSLSRKLPPHQKKQINKTSTNRKQNKIVKNKQNKKAKNKKQTQNKRKTNTIHKTCQNRVAWSFENIFINYYVITLLHWPWTRFPTMASPSQHYHWKIQPSTRRDMSAGKEMYDRCLIFF